MDLASTTQMLGSIGEFVGSVAVVVTLVFLTVQLRQNTSALKSSFWQAIQDAEQRFDTLLSRDRELSSIWVRGSDHGLDSFDDPVERLQFLVLGKQLVDLFQTHHYQHDAGMIENELWGTWISQYDEFFQRSPGFRDVIRDRYPHLRPSFRAFIDAHPFRGEDSSGASTDTG